MRRLVAAGLLAAPFLAGATALAVDEDTEGVESFRIQDNEIVESSGLAFVDGLAVTVNDSGDEGRVFTIDPATGETVGVTTWADAPDDVEALAPAGSGEVWVADIGDNTRARDSIEVFRVPVGAGDRTADPDPVELTWPDGPRDAESLLADPRSGRLLVVSKAIFGGELMAAPEDLTGAGPHRLVSRGSAIAMATDAAFFPDGRHLVIRSYGEAAIYAYPSMEHLETVPLPEQEQGEGVAVSDQGRVFLSSEGRQQWVLELPLPADLRAQVAPADETDDASPSQPTPRADASSASDWWVELRDRDAWPLWVAGGGLLTLIALGVVVGVRRRG